MRGPCAAPDSACALRLPAFPIPLVGHFSSPRSVGSAFFVLFPTTLLDRYPICRLRHIIPLPRPICDALPDRPNFSSRLFCRIVAPSSCDSAGPSHFRIFCQVAAFCGDSARSFFWPHPYGMGTLRSLPPRLVCQIVGRRAARSLLICRVVADLPDHCWLHPI